MTKRETVVFVILAGVGLALWIGIANAAGEREAWDSYLFFVIGLPAMLVATAVAGYAEPNRTWLWGVAVVALQPVALLVESGVGPLIGVGIFFFGLFAGAGVLSAYVGASLRLHRNQKEQDQQKG